MIEKHGLRKRSLCNHFWCIKIHARDGNENSLKKKKGKVAVLSIALRKVFMLNKLQGS